MQIRKGTSSKLTNWKEGLPGGAPLCIAQTPQQ